MSKGNCGNCECFHPDSFQTKQGSCRLNSPNAIMTVQQTAAGPMPAALSFFPPVQASEWCMQYKPRTSESPKYVEISS